MTFRRVMLVVLPLMGAAFLFMVLRFIYIDWESTLSTRSKTSAAPALDRPAAVEAMQLAPGISHDGSTGLNLVRKDKNGNPEMQLLAEEVVYPARTTAAVTGIRILFFTRSAADRPPDVIALMADHARLVTKGSILNLSDVVSAYMWGNVAMADDRATPDDHSDDMLMGFQDLTYDAAASRLLTDGPVIVAGLEMNLTARKMRIALDPDTRRIDSMTFLEDIFISMETGGSTLKGLAGPSAEPAPRPGAVAAAPARSPPASAPPARAVRAKESSRSGSQRVDLWQIELAGNVDARQATQRVRADYVKLYNKSATAGPPDTVRPPAPAAGGGAAAGGAGAAAGARLPAPNTEGAAAARAPFLQPDAPPPLDVMADGPLIITPLAGDAAKSIGDEADVVTVTGRPAIVNDDQASVVGEEIRYNTNPNKRSGTVIGKEAPFVLDQPGKLHLTGGRLDFVSNPPAADVAATAEVRGEGRLHAAAQSVSLAGSSKRRAATGGPSPAKGLSADAAMAAPAESARPAGGSAPTAADEQSTLEASWTRGMRLEFYRLPADDRRTAGEKSAIDKNAGEIKRAEFYGQASLTQKDGFLKGDELAIDFFKPEAGRGQAVEHLLARGNVHIKNTQPQAGPTPADAAKSPGKMTVGDIACQKELDVRFTRDAAGNMQPKDLRASGTVNIKDIDGRVQAENLAVRFGTSAAGATEVQFLDARGAVLIDRTDLYAEGDHVLRNLDTGEVLLEGRPARAKRGQSRIVGPRIEFSQAEGNARVTGAGELEMPATTDLRGTPTARPIAAAPGAGTARDRPTEPLIVQWTNGMLFEDKRNFVQFDGAVRAAAGGGRLNAQRLWIYFADRPAAEPAAVAAAPATARPKSDPGDLGAVFGPKTIVRVLAEKDVHAVEQRLGPDKNLQSVLDMAGDNLTYVQENRKAYIRGPGRLRVLSRDRSRAGEEAGVGLAPDALPAQWQGAPPDGYSRTDIAWTEGMAYEGSTDRAYFKGNVDADHVGRSTAATGAASRVRKASTTRVRSNDMQVVFTSRRPAAGGAAGLTGGAPSAPASSPPATGAEDRMAVDKFVADGNVFLWVDDRRGSAERLLYQRDPELVRLYRGADDWARLWQEDEQKQQFGEIVARTITYEPSTSRVDVVDQQQIIVSPQAKPALKAAPKSAPGKAGPAGKGIF